MGDRLDRAPVWPWRVGPTGGRTTRSKPRSDQRWRCVYAAFVAGILLLGLPATVEAHAELILASPASGTGLAQAPSAVVILFSEPLNIALSQINVLDGGGAEVGQGPTVLVPGDPRAMQRPLGLLPTGQYTVAWTSVSVLDGHVLEGTYSFAVGTEAGTGTTLADSPLDSEGPLGLVGQFAALVALGTWLAAGLLRSRARLAGLDPTKTARIARLAPAAALAATAIALVSTTLAATGSLTSIAGVLASPSGEARLVVLGAAAVGVVIGTRWAPVAIALAALAIGAEAASGHAASSVLPPIAIGSFAIHLGAVGVWIYAIAASLVAAPSLRRALGAFTPYAVAAAAITAATGIINAVLELTSPADLIQTGYGLTLLAKSAAFVGMASFGLLHFIWRRRPARDETGLRGPLRVEASAALVALILATLLVSFPNPPREVAATSATLTSTDPVLAELAGRDALSVAAASGDFVVGLTILPPRPGPAEVRVQVLGVDPGDGLRNARFAGSSGSSSVGAPLDQVCGLGCFAGDVTFPAAGEWTPKVAIDSNRGPIAISESIPLPTPDGSAALTKTLTSEAGLKSAVLTESLSGSVGGQTYVSTYRFEAPDRVEITINGTSQILAGLDQYRQTGSGPWTKTSFPAPGFSWPVGYYSDFWAGAEAVRIIGTDSVDGVPAEVITFIRPDIPAWFRVWVGSDGVVLRDEMRAEGHIMDHVYADLNGPITVQVPP